MYVYVLKHTHMYVSSVSDRVAHAELARVHIRTHKDLLSLSLSHIYTRICSYSKLDKTAHAELARCIYIYIHTYMLSPSLSTSVSHVYAHVLSLTQLHTQNLPGCIYIRIHKTKALLSVFHTHTHTHTYMAVF